MSCEGLDLVKHIHNQLLKSSETNFASSTKVISAIPSKLTLSK